MQFGPPGGMRPNWGRGSQQIQKKTSVQVKCLDLSFARQYRFKHSNHANVQVQPTNRFAMFDVDDDGGVSAPPQPQYHGRASEPVISRSYGGRNSREGSKSREGSMGRRDSREGSYAGSLATTTNASLIGIIESGVYDENGQLVTIITGDAEYRSNLARQRWHWAFTKIVQVSA